MQQPTAPSTPAHDVKPPKVEPRATGLCVTVGLLRRKIDGLDLLRRWIGQPSDRFAFQVERNSRIIQRVDRARHAIHGTEDYSCSKCDPTANAVIAICRRTPQMPESAPSSAVMHSTACFNLRRALWLVSNTGACEVSFDSKSLRDLARKAAEERQAEQASTQCAEQVLNRRGRASYSFQLEYRSTELEPNPVSGQYRSRCGF